MPDIPIVPIVLTFVALIVVIPLIISSFFVVQQQEAVVIERFGKFNRICLAGLHLRWPIIERKAHEVTLKIEQLDIDPEVKTSDNVFAKMKFSIQYYISSSKIYEACYKLENPEAQIEAYALDTVRAEAPKLTIDELFSQKDQIAVAIQKELADIMDEFGYVIHKSLAVDVEPNSNVKSSMNDINAAQRQRIAANERGEADRILKVKQAEGEAEASRLQGKGIADKRREILNGYRDSMEEFKETMQLDSKEVMNYVLVSQYLETMKEMAEGGKSNTIFMDSAPDGISQIQKRILGAMNESV